jgi:hypothetical protein
VQFKMVRPIRLQELIQTINDATLREKITEALELCSFR